MKRLTLLSIGLILTTFTCSVFAEEKRPRPHYFFASIGFAGSEEQHDIMIDTYSDRNPSGGGNMLHMELGYSFGLAKGFSLAPQLTILAYRAKFTSQFSPTGNIKGNYFFIPAVSARYDIGNLRQSFYVTAQIGKNSASTSFARVNSIDPDGLFTSLAVGFRVSRFHFELGQYKLPVTIDTDSVALTPAEFGGTYFIFKVGSPRTWY